MPDMTVTLFDHQWELLNPPGPMVMQYEQVNAGPRGDSYPTVDSVRCTCGHAHTMVPGPKYRQPGGSFLQWPKLPDTIHHRFGDTTLYWCERCGDVHEDYDTLYWACTVCGADLGTIPMANTGPFTWLEERGLGPGEPATLRLLPGGAGTITMSVHQPHLYVDGDDLGEVIVGECVLESNQPLTVDVTPLTEDQAARLGAPAPVGV